MTHASFMGLLGAFDLSSQEPAPLMEMPDFKAGDRVIVVKRSAKLNLW